MNFADLKLFFEESEHAKIAADSIHNGREIALIIAAGDQGSQNFTFTKEGGKNVLREGNAPHPDFTFTIPEAAAQELVTKKFESVGQVGLHIFDKLLSNDPNQKIRVKLEAGILALITGGYFGVLTAGGGDVAKFLASKGLGNIGKLKNAISKMRG